MTVQGRRIMLVLVGILLAATGASASPAAPSAEAYYQWLNSALVGVWQDVPAITSSAEQAARLFVEQDWDLGAWGDTPFVFEFINRAGGVMPIIFPVKPGEGARPMIALYAPRENQLAEDWVAVRALQAHGAVIAFTRPEIVAQAAAAGITFAAVIDNHAAPHGGLFPAADGKSWIVPTDPVSNMMAMWTWIGEFVGACTRLGKMPTMWESVMVPGAIARDTKFRKHRYQTWTPTPVAPGEIGKRYLRDLRAALIQLHYLEGGHIRQAAEMALAAKAQGHALYYAGAGHSFSGLQNCPHDPGLLAPSWEGTWWDMRKMPAYKPGDFVLGIGYDAPFEGKDYQNWAPRARAAGARLAWSFTDYNREAVAGLPPDEIFINQRWELGDALVQFPGYDIKVLPPSGVLAQSVLWMVEAEMLAGGK